MFNIIYYWYCKTALDFQPVGIFHSAATRRWSLTLRAATWQAVAAAAVATDIIIIYYIINVIIAVGVKKKKLE